MNHLQIKEAQMNNGVVSLWLSTIEGAVQFPIGLDFKNNRMLMNPYAGAEIAHFGNKQSAVSIRGFYQFMRDLFKNGKLQVEDAQSRYVLGYKDAFIPQHIDLIRTIKNLQSVIDRIDEEITTYGS